MEIKILLFCTAMAFTSVLGDNCQAPYVRIGDGCYFISNNKVSGDAAFALCAKRGAYLANFETLEEAMIMKMKLQQNNSANAPLNKQYQDKIRRCGLHYYVGGRNINRYVTGGDWRWIKNEQMTKMTYYAFGDGEPNGSIAAPQDCMFFYAQDRYKFHNVMCDNGNYLGGYICEK